MDTSIEFYKEQLKAKEDMLAMTTSYMDKIQADLEEKNKIISELYKDTLDSIHVAQYLQEALLPNPNILKSYFKDAAYFIKQKALVGGDIIFVKNNNDGVLFGLLDATGHGVPAAILSISCILLLRELSSSIEIADPKALLNLLDYQLEKTFDTHQDRSFAQAEGTLFGFCSKHNTLSYCAPRGKGFLISTTGEISEITQTKKSLGDMDEISLHNLPINPDKLQKIVLFSDGLTDQFGGENDKRFSKKRLKNLVAQHHQAHAQEFVQIIEQAFLQWSVSTEQTDDVSLLVIDF